MNVFRFLAVPALVMFGHALALATPTSWIITSTGFSDGGTLSGSFVFDPTGNQFSSINVTSSAGTSFAGANYTVAGSTSLPMFPTAFTFQTNATGNLTGTPAMYMIFPRPWWNGTTATAVFAMDSVCLNAGCSSGNNIRMAGTTTLTAATVSIPEPSSLSFALFGALALLGTKRIQTLRRDRSNS